MKKFLLFLMCLLAVTTTYAATKTITINCPGDLKNPPTGGYSTTYTEQTVNGFTFKFCNAYKNGTNFQIKANDAGAKAFNIYNVTPISNIQSVKITYSGSGSMGTLRLAVGESVITGNTTTGVVTKKPASSPATLTPADKTKSFFHIDFSAKGSGVVYVTKIEIEYEEADTPKALGDLAVTYGDNQSVADDGSATVPEGTVFNFKAENATSLKVTDVEDNVIAQGTDAATWTAVRGEYILTATAVGVDASGAPATKAVIFQVNVKGIEPEAVVITPAPVNDEITVARGSVVKFYSKNATSLKIENEDGETIVPGDTYDLTVNKEQTVSITPIKGEKEYTDLGVIVAIKLETAPLCGQVVFSPAAGEVEAGTVVTISAPNAKSYLYSVSGTELNGELVQGDSFTYTVSSPCTITVTPYNADEVEGTETSAAYTIKESTDEVWTLVTSASDLKVGDKYIIAVSLSDAKQNNGRAISTENYSNNRKSTFVTITDNKIVNPAEEVMHFTLEKDGDDWLWKTINYLNSSNELADLQVYLSSEASNNRLYATNPIQANLKRRNTSVAINDETGEATIQFVNCKSSNVLRTIYYNNKTVQSGGTVFNGYVKSDKDYLLVKIFKLVEIQSPELGEPVFVPADNSAIESGTEVTVTIPNSEVVIVTPYLIDGSLGTSVSNPGQTATLTVNKWHRRFLVQGSLDDNLGEEKEAFYFLTGSETCDYPITVNHGTYEPWEEHQPAAAPAREAATTGSAEMDSRTSDDGTITYTARLNNMAGLFSLNLEGENGSLMGHRTDAVACDETCTEHPKHVYVQPGQSYNLVHSANENAVQLSTIDLHNVYGNGYKTADLTVTLDPFRSATMSIAGDSQELTGVTDVAVDNAAAPVEYYDLQGRRIDAPAAGSVVIRRQGADVRKIHIR